jgi:hypothetical protein
MGLVGTSTSAKLILLWVPQLGPKVRFRRFFASFRPAGHEMPFLRALHQIFV